MKQIFNFATDIEKRMPDTGKVYFVDRMTSDYALAHPFNVDEFIEQVYQKYEQMAADDPQNFGHVVRDREQLHRMWNLVLQMPDRGDKSLYPNQHGPQPALMEVWHKAGDYWRRGFRTGDILPVVMPGRKITRLGDGEWICLFPSEAHLLTDAVSENTQCNTIQNVSLISDAMTDTEQAGCQMSTDSHFSRRQPRSVRRSSHNSVPVIAVPQEEVECHSDNLKLKIVCGVATAVVFLVLVNTVGLFGVAALGLLAGGIIK